MRTVTAVVAGVLVGAASLAGGRAVAALQDAPPKTACVAFVDVNRVFQAYPRAKRIVEDLQKEADQLKASLAQRDQDLRKAAQDLDGRLEPGTAEYESGRRKIQLEIDALQYDRKSGLDSIVRKQVTGMAAVYKEVRTEAERIASEKGYAAVFNFDADDITVVEKGQYLNVNELKLQMALRPVLWARPDLDLTREVVAALGTGLAEEPGEKQR